MLINKEYLCKKKMAKVFLERMSGGTSKKTIYKYVDGKLTDTFNGLSKAAFNAGTSAAGLSAYLNKRIKKPGKIPANVEYSFILNMSK